MKRRKKLNSVYMREVTKSLITTEKNDELNSYVTCKKILDIEKECKIYVNGVKITLVDKGYTILEYSPIDKLYNVRIFIDDNNDVLLYYFDVIAGSEYIDGEIYYDDLYLDVIFYTAKATGSVDYIQLDDEADLINAYNNGLISKNDFDNAYKIADEIMCELKSNNNIFVNRGLFDLN